MVVACPGASILGQAAFFGAKGRILTIWAGEGELGKDYLTIESGGTVGGLAGDDLQVYRSGYPQSIEAQGRAPDRGGEHSETVGRIEGGIEGKTEQERVDTLSKTGQDMEYLTDLVMLKITF